MIKEKHRKQFLNICNKLNKLMNDIKKYNPEANYYLSNDIFNLMKGPTHTENNPNYIMPIFENVVESVIIKNADGGDW